jgi:hypothetical protein
MLSCLLLLFCRLGFGVRTLVKTIYYLFKYVARGLRSIKQGTCAAGDFCMKKSTIEKNDFEKKLDQYYDLIHESSSNPAAM